MGHMQEDHLDGVLFDHLMLEGEQKGHISNYADFDGFTISADLKWEVPHDGRGFGFTLLMQVSLTAARSGKLENPRTAGFELDEQFFELSLAIKAIREAESRRRREFKALQTELALANSSMDCRKSYESYVREK